MDELDKIRNDIVEIKLEIKPLERLPDKLDELIRSQQEFMQLLFQNYCSEKSCLERREASNSAREALSKRICKLEAVIDKFMWGVLGSVATVLAYLYQVTHK